MNVLFHFLAQKTQAFGFPFMKIVNFDIYKLTNSDQKYNTYFNTH